MAERGGSAHGMLVFCTVCLLLLQLTTTQAHADSAPDPDYTLHRDPRPHMKLPVDELPILVKKGRIKGKQEPDAMDTTTRLPEFVPDGPRPYIPDPTFMPGDRDIAVHEGDVAVLPCTVQNLGTKEVSIFVEALLN
jgi:hypothetical protein